MTIENLRLPQARIVGGHPMKKQNKTNFSSKEPEIGKDGQPVIEYRCELAIPKAEFMTSVWPAIAQEVAKVKPNLANQHPDNYDSSSFSFKVINGDSPACPKGSKIPYNTREGYPGHYIIKIRTVAFQPSCSIFENGAYRRLDEKEIKCGDYVVANVNLTGHTSQDGGLYWNPNGFCLVRYGQEILTSVNDNPEELFGAQGFAPVQGSAFNAPMGQPQMAQAPQGFNAQPMAQAPQGFNAQPMAQAPQGFNAQPMAQAPQYPAAPAHDFVQNAGYAQPMAQAPQGFNAQPMAQAPYAAPMGQPQMAQAPYAAPAHDFVQNAGYAQAPNQAGQAPGNFTQYAPTVR